MSIPIDSGELMSMRTRSILSPADRDRVIACIVSKAPTALVIALRLARSASASSPMVCSGGSQTAR